MIYLVRHGQSTAQIGVFTENPAAIELTELGKAQAALISVALPKKIGHIAVSPYTRATQTALPISAKYTKAKCYIWSVEEFTYLAPEKLGGLTQEERWATAELFWKNSDPHHIDGPSVESFFEFMYRVRDAMNKMASFKNENLVVVTHAMFTRAVMWLAMRKSYDTISDIGQTENMRRFKQFCFAVSIPNASITSVKIEWPSGEWFVGPTSMDHLPAEMRTE